MKTDSIERIKAGVVNAVFQHPSLIAHGLERLIDGSICSVREENDNSIIIDCQSPQWAKETYSRAFKLTAAPLKDGWKKVIDAEEI